MAVKYVILFVVVFITLSLSCDPSPNEDAPEGLISREEAYDIALEYVEWVANNPPVAYSLLLSTREHHATTMGRSYSNDGRGDEHIWVAAFEFDDITYMAIPGGDGGPRPGGRSTGAVFNHMIARVDAVTGDISGTALLRPWSPRPYPMTGEMPTPIPSPSSRKLVKWMFMSYLESIDQHLLAAFEDGIISTDEKRVLCNVIPSWKYLFDAVEDHVPREDFPANPNYHWAVERMEKVKCDLIELGDGS
jgi:hypothetical protein